MTFYFYDLETSGFNPRKARIMQFAGQRTDENLNPIGEPDNFLIKMTEDILPDPDAILVTGITPQATLSDGITEVELAKFFNEQVATPDTVITGFNNIRFDNEFMRFMMWRNFWDAYEWSWKNSSTWDLLDLVRMTRALRPEGIKWPFAPDGKPSNRLELLADTNKLMHANAHDALSDVNATIDLAKLIKNKQPKLFNYSLEHRSKNKIAPLVTSGMPLVYTSGRYPSDYEKTTIAIMIAPHPDKQAALMYDLRIDPEKFVKLSPSNLAAAWQARGPEAPYFPVKVLTYNKAPAIAPCSVLDKETEARLKIDKQTIDTNLKKLQEAEDFGDKLIEALRIIQPKHQTELEVDRLRVDELLYDGFVSDSDRTKMRVVRVADANKLADLNLNFADKRLEHLLLLYKARNYPSSLNPDDQEWWESYKTQKLLNGKDSIAAIYFKRINELSTSAELTIESKYLLEELKLYGEAVVPLA